MSLQEPPPAGFTSRSTASTPSPIGSFLLRCVLAYILLYVFPFPISTFPKGPGIPGTGWLADGYKDLMHAIVPWVGKACLGVEITRFPAGSGDTTYNYVELLFFAVLAVLAAAAWTAIRRGRPVAPRTLDLVTVYVRYFLASVMLAYGLDKVLLLQFAQPGPARMMVTYGESSPFGLLWTSLGASKPYQFFGGLAETVGAVLLLWRRTALLGALLLAGVLLNVVMLNVCYDVPVKISSSHLLLLTLFVAAPHLRRLLDLLLFNRPTLSAVLDPFPVRGTRRRRTLLGLKAAFIAWIAVGQAWQLVSTLGPRRWLPAHRPLHGYYRVESFTLDGIADRALPDSDRWVLVGIDARGSAAVRLADGSIEHMGIKVDEVNHSLGIRGEGPSDSFVLEYAEPEPSVVVMQGPWRRGTIAVRLREIAEAQNLEKIGFRWINEFPDFR